ncbi:flavin-binding monooxygenase [Fomitiporia mediterranea MF3/22]|uniref:flavin-binding monooxygenase n=1 Tax=Fomitiporia mediterranea (strain MF3/22) TaxID=694068 RepID=UPI00044095D8|nr:flavin-binding monooxygenase [Fomitiporia mediterranea MF3/22]EJD04697.1 flavin-binding monooxygenase [Fomitiporia mediterranea MF3/22]
MTSSPNNQHELGPGSMLVDDLGIPSSPSTSDSLPSPPTTPDEDVLPQLAKAGFRPHQKAQLRGRFKLSTLCIDDDRPFKVVVIGAGHSGVMAGIRFTQRMTNIDLTIYDKNSGVGGTWFTNRYPYQPTFGDKSDWTAFYSPGPEIRAEIEKTVEKYKLMKYIKLRHELIHAKYDEEQGKWHLKLRRAMLSSEDEEEQCEIVEDTADFVLAAVGSLSRWSWPDIEGIKNFKGKLIHSAAWETDESGWWHSSVADWKDKKVGVIGSGSTATQIVPRLRPFVKHLYNYVRGKTWLGPSFASDRIAELLGHQSTSDNHIFTPEDKEKLRDMEFYNQFRREVEQFMNSMHFVTIKDSAMQKEAQKAFKQHMTSRLQKKPWIADHLIPDFSVSCRRITPDTGYLEALQEDNTDFIPTLIKRITETGIELVDGTHHELDVIVCATGFDVSYQYPFTVVGRNGKTLNERFSPHPETYISMSVDGFPNWFMSMGPNSIIGTGSMILIIEHQINYIVEVAQKMQREYLKSIEPKLEAVKDFDEYLEAYIETTSFSDGCRSWYKQGKVENRNVGVWPGSCLHAMKTFRYPRWEDYNYEILDSIPGSGKPNRLYWLGDGSTHNEKYMTGDRAWYLNPEEVDLPPTSASLPDSINCVNVL